MFVVNFRKNIIQPSAYNPSVKTTRTFIFHFSRIERNVYRYFSREYSNTHEEAQKEKNFLQYKSK